MGKRYMIRNIGLILCKNKELNMHLILNWLVYSISVITYNILWVLFPSYLFITINSIDAKRLLIIVAVAISCLVAMFLRSYLKSCAWMKINRIRYACLSDILEISIKIPYEKQLCSDVVSLLNVTKMAAMNPEIGIGKIMVNLYDLFGLFFSVFGLLWILSKVSYVFIIVLLIFIAIEAFIQNRLTNYEAVMQKRKNTVLSVFEKLNDITMGYDMAKEVRLFSLADVTNSYSKDFSHHIGEYEKEELIKTGKINVLFSFEKVLRMVIIYLFMIFSVRQGVILPTMFLTYVLCSLNLANNINSLIALCFSIGKEMHSFDGYWTLKDYLPVDNFIDSVEDINDQISIEFRNVSYTYPGAESPALKEVSFKINKGERIALIGKNGSGKTTCIKLLCGLITPQSGEILINGKRIQEYQSNKYSEILRCVSQDGVLFPYTLAENIALTNCYDLEKVQKAANRANIADFVLGNPDKYNMVISKKLDSKGIEVSGGEKQGMLLARALYRDSGKIFLLDEPAGALDPFAEDAIFKRYEELTKNTTSIIVVHQFQFTPKCDEIIVLKDGVVHEKGSHIELLKRRGDYYSMYEKQKEKYKNE